MKQLIIPSLTLFLVACGGGGGSDSGNNESLKVSSPDSAITIEGETFYASYGQVEIRSSGVTARNIYFAVFDESEKMLEYAELNFYNEEDGYYALDFKPGYMIGDGATSSNITFAFCYDDMCNEHVKGSPFTVKATFNVNLEEKISAVEGTVISLNNNLNSHKNNNIMAKSISTTGEYASLLFYQTSHEYDVATTFKATNNLAGDGADLDIQLKLPTVLGVGQHTGKIDLFACYDEACEYPVKGSPISYLVDYSVQQATGIIDNSLEVNERLELTHDVLDSEYVPGLDIIVMTSSHPENALYVYDIQADREDKFSLDNYPGKLAVDKISRLGRIVVADGAYNAILTVIDYNKTDQENSPNNVISAPYYIENLLVKNDTLLMTPNSVYEQVQRLTISSGEHEELRHNNLPTGKLHLTENADAIYALSNGSPEKLGRYQLGENLALGQEFNSPYHGDYSYWNIWLSKDGKSVYTGFSYIFSASNNEEEDGKKIGKLESDTLKGPFYAFAETETNIAAVMLEVEKEYPSEWLDNNDKSQVKIANKSDYNVSKTISFADIDGVTDRPIYLTYTDLGSLYAITRVHNDAIYPTGSTYAITKIAQ